MKKIKCWKDRDACYIQSLAAPVVLADPPLLRYMTSFMNGPAFALAQFHAVRFAHNRDDDHGLYRIEYLIHVVSRDPLSETDEKKRRVMLRMLDEILCQWGGGSARWWARVQEEVMGALELPTLQWLMEQSSRAKSC